MGTSTDKEEEEGHKDERYVISGHKTLESVQDSSKVSWKAVIQHIDLMNVLHLIQDHSNPLQAPGGEASIRTLMWLWMKNCSWDLQGQ